MDFRLKHVARAAALAGALLALPALAATPVQRNQGKPARSATPTRVANPFRSNSIDNIRRMDVNNLNMYMTNYGSFAWDLTSGNSGLVYPKGTTKTAVFAAGLWLGAQVGGEKRTVVAEYSQEYGPGNMPTPGSMAFSDPSDPRFINYKVVRYESPADSAHLDRSADDLAADPLADPLVHHSWSEYINGAAPFGAPTRMYRLDNTSTPATGDSVDVLGPDVSGDMMMWAVFNDADAGNHTNDAGGSTPLGVQIQQTTFAFNRQGALGNTIFLRYKIKNVGPNTLDSMYVSIWSDPDLGGAGDDLVGCDTTLSLGYVYNATNSDQLYGDAPPAVGFDFFLGPINSLGDTLGLTSFNKYINGTDPASTDETYYYMQGVQPTGDLLVNPTNGEITQFFHSGDPVTGSGWLDSNPSDRRLLLTSGPFTMDPGDEQTIVAALIVGQGNDRLSSISGLRFFDKTAQAAFNTNFNLPSPPPQPQVDVATDHGQVHLSWDSSSRTNYNQPGWDFEGYNVYQGSTVAGPWKRIATYDEINNRLVIFDEVFDVTTGQTLPSYPTAFGSNTGIQFDHLITQDAVRGGELHDGMDYYFAVTAYSVNDAPPAGLPKVLENAQTVIRVRPQRAPAGTDLSTASATPVTYLRKDGTKPPATDVVTVDVINPALVTGHTYKVTFSPTVPLFSGQVGTDTATVKFAWTLTDSTTGDVKETGQLNKRGDEDYRVVDGLLIKVSGAYFPAFQDAAYQNLNTAHRRALAGVSAGLEFFGGGAGLGDTFFGSTINPVAHPDSFKSVEIRFSSVNTQKAYRYLRLQRQSDGGAPNGDRVYPYAGFHTCNFQVWDVTNNVQLDAAFVERGVTDATGTLLGPGAQLASFDSTWAPRPDDLATGNREYLFVLNRPYSSTPKAEFDSDQLDDGGFPLLYALWSTLRGASDVIDDGDKFKFTWANPATTNDVYVFGTSALVSNNSSLAANNLSRIRVVPNPYYNRSRYEISQFNRIVRFINMPETATVKIFNLSGKLIRTLEKTNASSSILEWDLETDNQLPVASGVYVYLIDAGSAGQTFGRVVVFMEKERLNNF